MKNGHVIVTFVVLVGAAGALNVWSERRHEQQLAGLRTEMRSLSVPVEAAQDRPPNKAFLTAAAPVLARQTAPLAPEPGQDDEDEAAPQRDAQDEPPRPTFEPAEMKSELDTVFASERPDPAWTSEASRTVSSRVAAVLPESSALRDVDCHASMCRIETSHTDLESYRNFVQGAFMIPGTRIWNAGFFASPPTPDARGELTATVYLAREGEPLPVSVVQ
ncbi:hypothetical protein WME79_08390 [Sorangium sp. So ce726]|uniref:hypothetical protein n=1 Tax=Sorangium sp. So ce726 TaxID=3133319 RepID=UPI003F614D64